MLTDDAEKLERCQRRADWLDKAFWTSLAVAAINVIACENMFFRLAPLPVFAAVVVATMVNDALMQRAAEDLVSECMIRILDKNARDHLFRNSSDENEAVE